MTTALANGSRRPPFPGIVTAKPNTYTRYHQAYYYAFLVALVICWSPSKFVAYIAPWFAVVVFLFLARSRNSLRRLILVFLLWLAPLPLYAFLTPEFAIHSAILSLITYGSFVFLSIVSTRQIAGEQLSERMLSVARWVLLFQGSWGALQGILAGIRSGTFDGTTGDAVAGTISPFVRSPDFSNPMFAVNIALLLLFLFPSLIREGRGRVAFIVGTLALILASVVHVLLMLFLAISVAFTIYFSSFFLRKQGLIVLVGLLAAAITALYLLNHNFSTASGFIIQTLEGRTPRSQVIQRTFTTMLP